MRAIRALIVGLALCVPTLASAQPIVSRVYDSTRVLPNFSFSKTRYLLSYQTPAPASVAVLFAGGNGYLNIGDDGSIPHMANGLDQNFLVRTRDIFVRNGVAAAVVDAPNKIPLSPESARMTADYKADIAALVAHIRQNPDLPPGVKIWLVGTSSGTISVVNVAAAYPKARKSPGAPDGIVLTSSQVATHNPDAVSTVRCTKTIYQGNPPMSAINVSSFVVTSLAEACPCSRPAHSTVLAVVNAQLNALANAPTKGHAEIADGGSNPGADVCSGFHAHGFFNVEDKAVGAITKWIVTH